MPALAQRTFERSNNSPTVKPGRHIALTICQKRQLVTLV